MVVVVVYTMPEIEVKEDSALMPEEKETSLTFSKGQDRVRIHSEMAAVVRWLLDHPDYREERSRISEGVQHATTGTLPVGALKLAGNPRKDSTPSGIIGKLPEDD